MFIEGLVLEEEDEEDEEEEEEPPPKKPIVVGVGVVDGDFIDREETWTGRRRRSPDRCLERLTKAILLLKLCRCTM
jgi:hypothetical protein